jgi:cell wall-associated NlpC family hydrolase
MSSPPSQRHRRRLAPVVIALVLIAAVATALGTPAAAGADSIGAKRAQAKLAEQKLHQLYSQEDAAVNAYDAARSKLFNVKQRIRANTFRLKVARRNLHAAQAQLASIVISAYKGGQPDPTMYVLGAGSFTDLVTRLDVINRTSNSQTEVLHAVTVAERQVAHEQRVLRADRARAGKLVARTHAAKMRVEGLISSQQAEITTLQHEIDTRVQKRKQRIAAQRAAARAAAAAAAQAAQNPVTSSPVTSSPAPPTTGPVPPASSVGAQAVQIAMGELGVPYVWGGASPAGFDCSGLTMWVYAQLGIQLDHYTGAQWNEGVHVSQDQLAPGDLVFFEPGIGHVGLYIGGGNFIEAPHTGGVVQISSLSNPWYAMEYQGAVRVTG